jgi:hypothetical protein
MSHEESGDRVIGGSGDPKESRSVLRLDFYQQVAYTLDPNLPHRAEFPGTKREMAKVDALIQIAEGIDQLNTFLRSRMQSTSLSSLLDLVAPPKDWE